MSAILQPFTDAEVEAVAEEWFGAKGPHRDTATTVRRLILTLRRRGQHESGEPHSYRVECSFCGQRGMVQLSIEPQVAP